MRSAIRVTLWLGVMTALSVYAVSYDHSQAKTATKKAPAPHQRVDRGFNALADGALLFGPRSKAARLPPARGAYQFDHDWFYTAGKGSFHKECAMDIRQDPGETSCKLVWAAI